MTQRKFGIIGCGPVGAILGAHLAKSGEEVVLIDPFAEHMDRIREDGIVIEGKVDLAVPCGRTYARIADAAAAGEKLDYVFLCTKTPIGKRLAPEIPSLLLDDGVGVSFQNGLDPEKYLLEECGADRTLRGAVNYAGNLARPGAVRMTFFNGSNYVGAVVRGNAAAEARARELAEILSACDLATEYTPEVSRHVWEKVIRNAGLMPVSALTGMNMKQVMESDYGLDLVQRLLAEAIAVAKEAGFELGDTYYEDSLQYYRNAGAHMPSMWSDVQAGVQTEIEFLNHAIAMYGDRVGVMAPYNRAMADAVVCIDELAALRKQS